jgi:hypothetical protein
MSQTMTGGCLCGAVRYEVSGAPAAQMVCHCSHCQKQTGSAFSSIMGVVQDQVAITGELASYADAGESGKAVNRKFCPRCGSPICSEVEVAPGMVWIKTGTLDDPAAFAPQAHIWTRSKQDWVETGAVPAFATNPG